MDWNNSSATSAVASLLRGMTPPGNKAWRLAQPCRQRPGHGHHHHQLPPLLSPSARAGHMGGPPAAFSRGAEGGPRPALITPLGPEESRPGMLSTWGHPGHRGPDRAVMRGAGGRRLHLPISCPPCSSEIVPLKLVVANRPHNHSCQWGKVCPTSGPRPRALKQLLQLSPQSYPES